MLRVTLLLSLMVLALGLERKADSEQIFFVGNSYTFFWNLPQTVQAMARIQNRSMEVQQSTASGASLEQHWSFGFCCATKSVSTQFLSPRGIQIRQASEICIVDI